MKDPNALENAAQMLMIAKSEFIQHNMVLVKKTTQDHMCSQCVGCYRDDHDQSFFPTCKLATDISLPIEAELAGLDENETHAYTTMQNPVAWASMYCEWEPRWYQKQMLACRSKKKVFRCGRRIGKTEVLAIEALHAVFTSSFFKVLIVCPYESQVALIFKRIRELISMSPELNACVVGDRKNPQEIELSNGSVIMGFTAGVKTGGQGDRLRGLTAHLIILDEMDFLDKPSLDSILAIYASSTDCRIAASSTPSGRHALFRDWCIRKRQGFKEFYFNGMVNPHWGPELEMFFRESLSEIGYIHEVLAEFGEQETGVYQHKYIDPSIYDYTYDKCFRNFNPGFLYVMGVDWNSTGQGTHFLICEYDPKTTKIKVVVREQIVSTEFNQLKGVAKIKELVHIWKPDFLYVDAGFGTTQVELLKEYGLQHPETKLHNIIRSIDMGSKTELKDPVTGEALKKHTKHLMVELSARRLETGQCMIPRTEDTKLGLIGQMREYRVERYGSDGRPVYTQGNDHALVAWQLAIFGLIMEFTTLANPIIATKIVFAKMHGRGGATDLKQVENQKRKLAPIPRVLLPQEIKGSGLTRALNGRRMLKTLGVQSQEMAAMRRNLNRPYKGRKNF